LNENLKSAPVWFSISLNCHLYRWLSSRKNILLYSSVLTMGFSQHSKHSWNAVICIVSFSSWITLIQIVTMRQSSIIFAMMETVSMYLWVSRKRYRGDKDHFFLFIESNGLLLSIMSSCQ
jgi:hypothetical protein